MTTRAHEIHKLRQEREARIQIRLEVAEGNKQLSEAAAEAGVRSQMFGVFHDAGYLGQYTLDAENIRLYKGIPEGGEILDYMGREELAANLFRITQTEGRLRREQIVGEDAAIQAHFRVGREVRDTLKRLGATMPEDLPTADYSRGARTTAPSPAETPETAAEGPGYLILAFTSLSVAACPCRPGCTGLNVMAIALQEGLRRDALGCFYVDTLNAHGDAE